MILVDFKVEGTLFRDDGAQVPLGPKAVETLSAEFAGFAGREMGWELQLLVSLTAMHACQLLNAQGAQRLDLVVTAEVENPEPGEEGRVLVGGVSRLLVGRRCSPG